MEHINSSNTPPSIQHLPTYNEDDVESDVLESDDNDGNLSDSNDEYDRKNNVSINNDDKKHEISTDNNKYDHDNDEYMSFIRSVFFDENDKSGTDGDEDEDYNPDTEIHVKEDDIESDDEYYHVTRKEVHDLVDGTVQTLAKNPEKAVVASSTSPSEGTSSRPTEIDPHRSLIHRSGALAGDVDYAGVELIQKKNRLISALVSKMFAGSGEEDIVVDDMPMNNIRKLVARQMSMALQLMMQMLLMSDDMSGCDKKCSSFLMELSNMRDAGVRKTALIRQHMESVRAYSSSSSTTTTPGGPLACMDRLYDGSSDEDDGKQPKEILTRRRALAKPSSSSSTIFDVPVLSRVDDLLKIIDECRKEKRRLMKEWCDQRNVMSGSASEEQCESSGNKMGMASHDYRSRLLEVVSGLLEQRVAPEFCVRLWRCLEPTGDYPLSREFASTVDPTSLHQRSVYTPAEDDLLLRGLVMTSAEGYGGNSSGSAGGGDATWDEIHRRYLPSKEKQSLQYRELQLTSGERESKFQKYRMLEAESKMHNRKWTPEEELSLLKGFQVFGSKWHMVKLYFLPHKTRNEIKLRWVYLLKMREKSSEAAMIPPVRHDGSLSKHIKHFLTALQSDTVQQQQKAHQQQSAANVSAPTPVGAAARGASGAGVAVASASLGRSWSSLDVKPGASRGPIQLSGNKPVNEGAQLSTIAMGIESLPEMEPKVCVSGEEVEEDVMSDSGDGTQVDAQAHASELAPSTTTSIMDPLISSRLTPSKRLCPQPLDGNLLGDGSLLGDGKRVKFAPTDELHTSGGVDQRMTTESSLYASVMKQVNSQRNW